MKTFNNQKPYNTHLLYDFNNFQVIDQTIILESDIQIKLPKQLIGQQIKQVELIPKMKHFEVIFTYQPERILFNIPVAEKILTIYLGANQFLSNTGNSIVMWHLLMKNANSNHQFSCNNILMLSEHLSHRILLALLKQFRNFLELVMIRAKYPYPR